MPCFSCNNSNFNALHSCRVCELLDNNSEQKTVTYCDLCKAYICRDCNYDLIRRAKAFIKS